MKGPISLEKLDFSGAVVGNEFMRQVRAFQAIDKGAMWRAFGDLSLEYLVPLTDGTERTMGVLDFAAGALNEEPMSSADLKRLVIEKFWAFGKSISTKTDRKVQNTEKLLRFFKFKRAQALSNRSSSTGLPPP